MSRHAHRMVGMRLSGGWEVREILPRKHGATGGFFSVGYKVLDASGRPAFMKALDIQRAFDEPDEFVANLSAMLSAHRDECALLDSCRGRRLDRVVWSLDDGVAQVDPVEPMSLVPYIIFELANADIRTHDRFAARFDLAWAARTLHHVATGLQQLHSNGIAHQDVKPSNVMVFDKTGGAKVGDLGCASQPSKPGNRDGLAIVGDRTYAPPEQIYGYLLPDWRARRIGCDLYQLGSLATFLFARVGMTELLFAFMDPAVSPGVWTQSYEDLLPHLRMAFSAAMERFSQEVPPEIRDELVPLIRYLCDPDPQRRGHPTDRGMRSGDPLSLQRFVSSFNGIATRAERGLVTKDTIRVA